MEKFMSFFVLLVIKVYTKKMNIQIFTIQKTNEFIDKQPKNAIMPQLKEVKIYSNYFLLSTILLSLTTTFLIWHVYNLKKSQKRLLKTIKHLHINSADFINKTKEDIEKTFPKDLNESIEKKIAKQLLNFEKSKKFLMQNITAGSLAADFNTNVVYLATVLKKHKKNNFSGYINTLRIEYITQKLKSDPEYSTYKISYLAKECGFSSHTTFIRVFTKIKGIPPSKYINLLETI